MRLDSLLLAGAAWLCASIACAESNSSAPSAIAAAGKSYLAPSFVGAPGAAAVRIELGPMPDSAVEAAKQANDGARTRALLIGLPRPVEAASGSALAWTPVGGGVVAHAVVGSSGARALRLGLRTSQLPRGAELRFSGVGDPGAVYGPFTADDVAAAGTTYWSPVLAGDQGTVEVYIPAGGRATADIAVVQVSHLFAHPAGPRSDTLPKNGSSAWCNQDQDLICRSASNTPLANVGTAVARMTYTESDGLTYSCNGTLLNPIGPQVPYLLSGEACISTQAEASTLTTHWLYDRSACGFGSTVSGYTQLPGGATLLHASAAAAFSFMRLNGTPPPAVWYAGWDSAALVSGVGLTAIHHPRTDWKKVNVGTFGGYTTGGTLPASALAIANWTSPGIMEAGSLGSGVFTAFGSPATDYRLRGVEWGGASYCGAPPASMYDAYSRFDLIYPSISQYLNPPSYALSVAKAGSGAGLVVSSPAGINCGATCSATYVSGTTVTLTPHAFEGSAFSGWSGACTGTGACVVSVTAARSVTATFVSSSLPAISGGKFYQCAVSDSGAVSCWGDNGSGKLGGGDSIQSNVPVNVGGIAGTVESIDAVQSHTCVLGSDGRVLCWGSNYFGELGNGSQTSSSTPLVVPLPASATALAVGRSHNCALTSGGGVYCWGLNVRGQLGNGQTGYTNGTPVAVQGLSSGALAVSAGSDHTCAIVAGGGVRCWGSNDKGQLGNGNTLSSSVPVTVGNLTGVAQLSAGMSHTCAVTAAGGLRCWGINEDAQLGDGTTVNSSLPQQIATGTPWATVSSGDFYTCAVSQAGALHCWGTSYWDVLGTGVATNTRVFTPAAVPALASGVTQVSTGRTHACAVRSGAVFCWGLNTYGAIGDGTTANRATPTAVAGLPAGISHVAAGNFHSCAVTSARRPMCWGYNGDGQLGGGTPVGRTTPALVQGLASGALEVSTGQYHTCALNAARGVVCWGRGTSGELGNNAEISTASPVPVQGLASGVSSLAVGGSHSCAVSGAAGEVYCWGYNNDGQLGDGTRNRKAVPVKVPNLSGIVSVTAGWSFTCALDYQGRVFCWGEDPYGALGLGSTTSTLTPLQVAGLPTIRQVVANLYHQCAVSIGGSVWCWGNNADGQLGDGSHTNRFTPVEVQGMPSNIARVATGRYHNCALTAAGAAYCWGFGNFGQIGDGIPLSSSAPIAVSGLSSGVVSLSAGSDSCAVLATGQVLCWGQNNFGQLGDGTYVWRAAPVTVLAALGAGTLDGNNWYLDLVPSKQKSIAKALTPSMLAVSQLAYGNVGADFESRIKYRASEFGRSFNSYVFGFVPPQFFSMVKTAPGTPTEAQLRAKSGENLVFAVLTPIGWTTLQGQLIALATGVASAAGNATNILNGIRLDQITGAKFCIGYGSSSSDMLSAETFREVLAVEGATATLTDRPCVLTGVYLDGPRGSRQGTPVTFVASVVGLSPTGTVQFLDGGVTLAAEALVPTANEAVRRASITTAALAPGVHSIGAAYSGDPQNAAESATRLAHEVTLPQVSARVELDGPRDSITGRPVHFWATVTGNNPSGTVQFRDGANNLGAAVSLVGGTATLRAEGLAAGAHAITAIYGGDGANTGGTSNALQHNVYDTVTTSVALASSANPAAFGATITLTATVSGNQPSGTVTFREGATVLARVPVAVGPGTASASITGLATGQHLIEADYSGDGNNQAVGSDVLVQQVIDAFTPAMPNVFLTSSANPSFLGQSITFSATVSGSGAPGGFVTFRVGELTLCSAAVGAGGVASCTSAALGAGVHLVTAFYSGDAAHAATSSSLLSQTVTAVAQLLSVSPAIASFGTQGINTTSAPVVVTLTNGSGGALSFTGLVLPAGIETTATTCGATLGAGSSCQRTFVFRPTFAGTLAGSIVFTYGGGATALPISAVGERSLIGHYYRAILNRAPDSAGKAFWEGEAARLTGLGVNVNEIWFLMANYFFNSQEYVAAGKTDTNFMLDVYSTFFNRPPDQGGFNFWMSQMAAGLSREGVIFWFMFSNEFRTFTQGIFGNTAARPEVDMVMDLFRGILNRFPETPALNAYVSILRQAQCTVESQRAGAVYKAVNDISYFFLFGSPEYPGRARTNQQFVSDMYNAFLRRGGSDAEVDSWIALLDQRRNDRNEIRAAFIASAEFATRVNAVIAAGCPQ